MSNLEDTQCNLENRWLNLHTLKQQCYTDFLISFRINDLYMNRIPKLSEHHKQNYLLIAVSHIHARLSRKDLQTALPYRTSLCYSRKKGRRDLACPGAQIQSEVPV